MAQEHARLPGDDHRHGRLGRAMTPESATPASNQLAIVIEDNQFYSDYQHLPIVSPFVPRD